MGQVSLGILMCAVITSITNSKIMCLGVDSPIDEIVDASKKYNPELIAMSISYKIDSVTSGKLLSQLKKNKQRHSNSYRR
jgi:methanogenic corrinoid protein MtbC1